MTELEAHLDARLLNRTTRRLSLTEIGRAFHERCVQLLADLEEAEESAGAGTVVPRGTLRLTCGVTFGTRYLAPAIAEFMARYPEMRFDVELSDRIVDLVDEGFDAAVRIGAVGGQNLVAPQGRRDAARLLRRRPRISRATASRARRRTSRRTRASSTRTRRSAGSGRSAIRRGASATCASRAPRTRTTASFLAALARRGRRHRVRAGFHRRSRRARGPPRADPARVRAAGDRHPRRVSEPSPPVGEGARVHRFPRAALHRRRMGARRAGRFRTTKAVTEAMMLDLHCRRARNVA